MYHKVQKVLGKVQKQGLSCYLARMSKKTCSIGTGGGVQIIRIIRLVRFVSLLNRLYATAMAASAIILPGVTVSHTHAHFFNLIFGGAMLLNFLSCLW